MFGSGDATPYDAGLEFLALTLGMLLTVGAVTAGFRSPTVAAPITRAAVLLAGDRRVTS